MIKQSEEFRQEAARTALTSGLPRDRVTASVETFFKSLKAKLVWRQSWPTRPQAEAAIFQDINDLYSTRRRHSYIDGISPLAFEAKVA